MKRNESNLDRIIRVILGAGLVVAGVLVGGTVGIVLYVLAAVMFITAITGFCLLYKRLHRAVVELPLPPAGRCAVRIDGAALMQLLAGVARAPHSGRSARTGSGSGG